VTEGGLLCWNCGRPTGILDKVMRSDQCENCLADLRSCRGCRHFDPTRRFHCRETIDSPVRDKEKSNLCDSFQMRDAIKRPGSVSASIDPKEVRKKRFDDLFDD
jgi:hypothetical protein